MSTSTTDPDPPISVPTPADKSDDTVPVSPITRQSTFPHHTLAAAATNPFIDTATPSINAQPVELDGTPTSPVTKRDAGAARAAIGAEGDDGASPKGRRKSRVDGGAAEDSEDEFLSPEGEDEVTEGLREKRAALLSSRSKDPAVLVDIPSTPGAAEYEFAKEVGGVKPTDPKPPAADKAGDASEA